MGRYLVACAVVLLAGSLGASQDKKGKKPAAPAKVTPAQAQKDAEHVLAVLPQLSIAAQSFYEAYQKPVPTDRGLRNKPSYLGWRFFLLPYLEQENLYRFLAAGVPTLDIPGKLTREQAEKQYTNLKQVSSARVGLYMLPRYGTKDRPETTVWRRVLVKGKEKLFIVVESSDRVLWIKSGDDLAVDPDKALPKGLGGNFAGGFFALCGDGKVRFLEKKLTGKQIVEALTTGKGVPALDTSTPAARKKALKGLKLTGGGEEP